MKLTNYINTIPSSKPNESIDKHLRSYVYLIIIRFVLAFVQIGQIHPDEHFQSVEIMTADQFGLEHTRTWEFNNTFPIRSIAISYFLIKIPLSFFDVVSMYTKNFLDLDIQTSYLLLVYPRLIMCLLSFINDWSIYKICESYSLKYEIRLLALGSSYVTLIFGTRTFSNTIEMAICSVLLYYVADCMIHSNTVLYKAEFLQDRYKKATSIAERVKIWKLKLALPNHSYNRLMLMSTLCVIGVFNRPTFLVFGTPMVFFWLLRGMGSKTITFTDFNIRICLFVICAIPTLLFCILCDSIYYQYLTTGEVQMLDFGLNNFVVTPLNFIKYNLDPSKTAEHGIHPKWLHFLVNIPLLYNVLGIIAMCSFGAMVYNFLIGDYLNLPRSQSIVGLMSAAIFTPTILLSLINHQEARFLIPITLPIILLHSPKLTTGFCPQYPFKKRTKVLVSLYENILSTRASAKILFKIWCSLNIVFVIFYGFLHQGGVYQLASHFHDFMKVKSPALNVNLITSHIYQIPLTLINIPSSSITHINRESGQKFSRQKDFFLYEYGGMDLDLLLQKIKLILEVNEMKIHSKKHYNKKYALYLAIPTSLTENLDNAVHKLNSTVLQYELVKVFYPHFSTEAVPSLSSKHPTDIHISSVDITSECTIDNSIFSFPYIMEKFSSVIHQLGLGLYKFEFKINLKIS